MLLKKLKVQYAQFLGRELATDWVDIVRQRHLPKYQEFRLMFLVQKLKVNYTALREI